MKLVRDMNLSPDLAPAIAAHGHDVVHWVHVGDPGAPDESVLAWARAHGRVLVTHDLDFSAILATTEADGPSVVQVRQHDLLSDEIVRAITAAIRIAANALEAGAIVTLHEERSRIRILPLNRR
ncbi:MAG: DUF5615 family PIN-like protein [Vicinamibacterales bacterium]